VGTALKIIMRVIKCIDLRAIGRDSFDYMKIQNKLGVALLP